MTGVCPHCDSSFSVPGGKGSRVANFRCPKCQVPLQGPNAGRKVERYRCPLTGRERTLDTSAQRLDQPHRIEYVAAGAQGLDFEPYTSLYRRVEKLHGVVLGAGAVVSGEWLTRPPSRWWPARLVPLAAEQAGDPSTWLVNQPITYMSCKACPTRVCDDDPRPQQPWTPVRGTYRMSGRRHNETRPVKPGPHPANTPACRDCLPSVYAPAP